MTLSPLAGKPAPKDILVDLARLEQEYYTRWPDVEGVQPRTPDAPGDLCGRSQDMVHNALVGV
jgi:hypothetical protein